MRVAAIVLLLALSACVYYEPYPAPDPYSVSWNAALAAAEDSGVRVVSADRATGVISGSHPPFDVRITVSTRADGRVQVEFKARGPQGEDPNLARRISEAYNRRMGR